MARHGPADVFLTVDGYDLTAASPQQLSETVTVPTVRTDGLGDGWQKHTPIGVRQVELSIEGAFFDTGANNSHAALGGSVPSSVQAVPRLLVYGPSRGVGDACVGLSGLYQQSYQVMMSQGDLHRANATYLVTGQRDECVLLQPLEAKTADWNTESQTLDNGASSANGAVGYLVVNAAAGITGLSVKIRDSADNTVFADLITFTNNVSAPFAERLGATGTVDRYIAVSGALTGTGSITSLIAMSRL